MRSGALRLLELDRSSDCAVHPFHFTDGQVEATVTLQLCGRSGLILGLLTSCSDYRINIHAFTCPRGTLNKEQGPRMKNTNLHDPDIYYHPSFDILWLLYINFFQSIYSVNGLYTNLCLWFDAVRVKTNLKFCLLIHYFLQKGMGFYVVDYLLG